ncbi:MAG: hypothetical protein WKF48_13715 [Solirubrobacteraceae bacterium]
MPRQTETCFDVSNDAIDAAEDERALDAVLARVERMHGLPEAIVEPPRHQVAWRRRLLGGRALPDVGGRLGENRYRALALGGAPAVHGEDDMPIARATDGPAATYFFRMDSKDGNVFPVGLFDERL